MAIQTSEDLSSLQGCMLAAHGGPMRRNTDYQSCAQRIDQHVIIIVAKSRGTKLNAHRFLQRGLTFRLPSGMQTHGWKGLREPTMVKLLRFLLFVYMGMHLILTYPHGLIRDTYAACQHYPGTQLQQNCG